VYDQLRREHSLSHRLNVLNVLSGRVVTDSLSHSVDESQTQSLTDTLTLSLSHSQTHERETSHENFSTDSLLLDTDDSFVFATSLRECVFSSEQQSERERVKHSVLLNESWRTLPATYFGANVKFSYYVCVDVLCEKSSGVCGSLRLPFRFVPSRVLFGSESESERVSQSADSLSQSLTDSLTHTERDSVTHSLTQRERERNSLTQRERERVSERVRKRIDFDYCVDRVAAAVMRATQSGHNGVDPDSHPSGE